MKKLSTFILSMIGLLAMAQAQTARVQAVHNCPDAAAAVVDVWLNDLPLLTNFSFQDASEYVNAPAGVDFDLSICAPNSIDTTGAIFRKTFNLPENGTFVVVASGGLAESGDTAFDLRAYVGQEQAANQDVNEISVNIIHGVYDAPAVDIWEVQIPAGELLPDLAFGQDIGSYVNLPAANFDVQVRTQAGVVVGEYDLDVTTLANQAAIVMATGYLDPSSQTGTEEFGLMAILPDGTVLPLSAKEITGARLQVIHNCAATDAAVVDVWINDALISGLDDFAFRTATPFIDAPAGAYFDVSICLPNSVDTVGALYRTRFLLESNMAYIVVASGTVGAGDYDPQTAFSLEVIAGAREISAGEDMVDVVVFHGATDAPTVDVVETQVGAGTIVDDISYAEAQGYLELMPLDYDLSITDMDGETTFFMYDADLSAFGNSAITVLASGFLNPALNNDGADFGLWVALAEGGALVELPGMTTSVREEQLPLVNEMRLYPVPAQDFTTLQFNTEEVMQMQLEIVGMDGKLLHSEVVQSNRGQNVTMLSLGNFPQGLYLVRLYNDQKISTTPLLIQ